MGYPVYLIHGMWCTGDDWSRFAGLMEARGYDCRAPSLPAHERGRRHPEVGSLSLLDYADFLERDLRAQNYAQPPVLIGHSMGGLLAQMLATRVQPLALVLLTPAAPRGINALTPPGVAAFGGTMSHPAFWRRAHKPGVARARKSLFPGIPAQRHAELYARLVEESGRALAEIAFWWLDRRRANRVDADAVRCPVYVVSCGLDRLTPSGVVRKVAARYAGSALRHWPERGHWVIDDEDTPGMVHEIVSWLQPVQARARQVHRPLPRVEAAARN